MENSWTVEMKKPGLEERLGGNGECGTSFLTSLGMLDIPNPCSHHLFSLEYNPGIYSFKSCRYLYCTNFLISMGSLILLSRSMFFTAINASSQMVPKSVFEFATEVRVTELVLERYGRRRTSRTVFTGCSLLQLIFHSEGGFV
ncbi:uncharacterized protein BJX67DRAFT_110956 [Aspergillus lucknowensis]|uniref:Uncharacterized protein n=1 Tax=Aspergillus lucknowensis TaxID=176173 RepID=A0ABR4LRF2_9EURO